MKLGLLTLSGLLFLTGCSSTGASAEQAIKIVEYEKCLEYQQSLIEEINKSLPSFLPFTEEEIIGVFDSQRGRMEIWTGKQAGIKKFDGYTESWKSSIFSPRAISEIIDVRIES